MAASYNANTNRSVPTNTFKRTWLDIESCTRRPRPCVLYLSRIFDSDAYTRPGNIVIIPCISRRRLPGWRNHDSSFDTLTVIFQATFVLSIYSRSYADWWWHSHTSWTFWWVSLGPLIMIKQNMKTKNYFNIIKDLLHHYMTSFFPKGNGIFQLLLHATRLELRWSGSKRIMMNST